MRWLWIVLALALGTQPVFASPSHELENSLESSAESFDPPKREVSKDTLFQKRAELFNEKGRTSQRKMVEGSGTALADCVSSEDPARRIPASVHFYANLNKTAYEGGGIMAPIRCR